MKKFLLSILLALPAMADPATADLSWTAPTQNVDGSPIAGIDSYTIYVRDTSTGPATTIEITDPLATSYQWTGDVQNGETKFYNIAVTDTLGQTSAESNQVSKTFAWNVTFDPNPPALNVNIPITIDIQCPVGANCTIISP